MNTVLAHPVSSLLVMVTLLCLLIEFVQTPLIDASKVFKIVFIYYLHVCDHFACISVCVPCVLLVSVEAREGIRSLQLELTGDC